MNIPTIGQVEDFTIFGSLGQGFAVEYVDADGVLLYVVPGFASYAAAYGHAHRTFSPAVLS